MIQMDPSNPEILHAGELFSRLVSYRESLLNREDEWTRRALKHMDSVHNDRETTNKRLFMSSVARNTDMIGSLAGINSTHNPEIAQNIPEYLLPVDSEVSAEHIAEVNKRTLVQREQQEQPSAEDVRLAELRQQVSDLSTPLNNTDFTADNDQFARAA